MSKVERVAVALFVADGGGQSWPIGLPDSTKELYRKRAQAAIEAMGGEVKAAPARVLIGETLTTEDGRVVVVRTIAPDGSFTALTRMPPIIKYDRDGKQIERDWRLDIDWSRPPL